MMPDALWAEFGPEIWAALTGQAGPNAALVSLGAAALGLVAGVVGTFLTLRKRALMSDALAHATLPGVGLAFLASLALGLGRNLPVLMLGAGLSALAGLWAVQRLAQTRIGQDAAIGAVLSTFYGGGVVILTLIQGLRTGQQAGLEGFLLGATAGMLRADVAVICIGGALVLAAIWALHRPFALIAFDEGAARVMGLNVARHDTILLALVLGVVLLGLQVVGLILIVALLITPAATARLWTHRLGLMAALAGGIGALCGWLGAGLSAALPDLPTGPVIVLLAFTGLLLSVPLTRSRRI